MSKKILFKFINKYRSTLVLAGFVIASGFVFISALMIREDVEEINKSSVRNNLSLSRFNELVYFYADKEKGFKLNAIELVILGEENMHFSNPKGEFFKGGNYEFSSEKGDYNMAAELLTLQDGIVKNKNAFYQANKIVYNTDLKTLIARGDVISELDNPSAKNKILLSGARLRADLVKKNLSIEDQVKGEIRSYYRFKRSIKFETEQLEYSGSKSLVTMKSGVFLTNGNYRVTAREGEIFLENQNKKLKYFALYDDIKFIEDFKLKDGSKLKRRAFSEKLEAIDLDREVVLTGAPRVLQGDDVIRGYKITLRENIDVVEVDDSQSFFRFKDKGKN